MKTEALTFRTKNTFRAEEVMDRLNEDYIRFNLSFTEDDRKHKTWVFKIMPNPIQISRTREIIEQSA